MPFSKNIMLLSTILSFVLFQLASAQTPSAPQPQTRASASTSPLADSEVGMIVSFFVVLLLMLFICIGIGILNARKKAKVSNRLIRRDSNDAVKEDKRISFVLPVYVENVNNDLNCSQSKPEPTLPPRSSSKIKDTKRLRDINGYNIPIN
jgi:cbb3-type cytochrome oxidase subunit 3